MLNMNREVERGDGKHQGPLRGLLLLLRLQPYFTLLLLVCCAD